MSNFKNDLKNAQDIEYKIMSSIQSSGHTVTSTNNLGYFPDYDLLVQPKADKPMFTIECKHDVKHVKTGSVAVETHKYDYLGNQQQSGLTATKADYYVYQLEDEKYIISTTRLKEKLASINAPVCRGGDNNSVSLSLVPTSLFKRWANKF